MIGQIKYQSNLTAKPYHKSSRDHFLFYTFGFEGTLERLFCYRLSCDFYIIGQKKSHDHVKEIHWLISCDFEKFIMPSAEFHLQEGQCSFSPSFS